MAAATAGTRGAGGRRRRRHRAPPRRDGTGRSGRPPPCASASPQPCARPRRACHDAPPGVPDAPACCGAARPPPAPRRVGRVGARRAPTAPAPASPGHHGGSGLAAPRARQARVGRSPRRSLAAPAPQAGGGRRRQGGRRCRRIYERKPPSKRQAPGGPTRQPSAPQGVPAGGTAPGDHQREMGGRARPDAAAIHLARAGTRHRAPRLGQPWRAPAAGASAAVASAPASPRGVLLQEDPGRVRSMLADVCGAPGRCAEARCCLSNNFSLPDP